MQNNQKTNQAVISILLVTHDNRILDVADRIIHLEDDKLVNNSTKEQAA